MSAAPKMPPADSPRQQLDNRTGGFVETLEWRPGFDDPKADRAQGTEPILFDVDIKYDQPAPWPMQVFLAMRPPHRGTSGLSLTFEDTGRCVSMLLRHHWTPDMLVEFFPEGTLGRAVALYVQRCPRVEWAGA
jgi:hypothetical protein